MGAVLHAHCIIPDLLSMFNKAYECSLLYVILNEVKNLVVKILRCPLRFTQGFGSHRMTKFECAVLIDMNTFCVTIS
jgi:hypothetical protein